MFIPAAAGLLVSWERVKPVLGVQVFSLFW